MNAYIEHTTERLGRVVTIAAVEKVTAKKVTVAKFGTYDRETGRPYIGAQRPDEARLLGWENDSYTTQHITDAGLAKMRIAWHRFGQPLMPSAEDAKTTATRPTTR